MERLAFFLFTLYSVHLAALAQTNLYCFHASDYVTCDAGRVQQSNFTYDNVANTFTVQASGKNNIAFMMDKSHDGEYYFENTQTWYAICATGISTGNGDNYLWWMNGYNTTNQTPPDQTIALADGRILLLWNLKTNTEVNGNCDFSSALIPISSHGTAFINAIGLTSPTGQGTISDVNHYAPYEVAVHYPETMTQMGYTAATLTAMYRSLAQQQIDKMDADKQAEWQARLDAVGAEEYTNAYMIYTEAKDVVENEPISFSRCTVERTEDGLHAVFDDSYHVYLSLFDNDVVRVYKSFNADRSVKQSLSVIAEPQTVSFNISESDGVTTLTTSVLRVVLNHSTGCVTAYRTDGTELIAERSNKWTAQKDGPFDSFRINAIFDLENDEQIYGMGQIQDGHLNRRNTSVLLKQVNMKISIPYFFSSKGYALFWDNYSPTQFTDNADGTKFTSTGTEIDYYILDGQGADGVLRQLRSLTGDAKLPPLWNFGLYQSKERYVSADETMSVMRKYRELGLPLDCIVQDWLYWGYGGENWNSLKFLNPDFLNYQQMIDTAHDNNMHLMISIWSNFGSATDVLRDMRNAGHLLPPETYPLNMAGAYAYDVYSQDARNIYWRHLYNGLVTKGIDAYWMDATEPEHTSTGESDYDFVSDYGRTWRSLYNAYPLGAVSGVHDHHYQLAHEGNEYLKDKRVSIMTRSGFIGMQRYAAQPWSADITASWETLAAQIPAALSMSACGIPYWNSDIGAFFTGSFGGVNDVNYRRLFRRWTQFGAFTTLMRFHGTNTPREPWQFGSANDGVGDYDGIVKYIKLRYKLLPYLYSTAWQVSKNQRTFMQAMPWAFPNDASCRGVQDQYMFGDAFLVAPVITDNTTSRNVVLPADNEWVDFWTGEQVSGRQTVNTAAPLDILPLYVKGGSIIPWGPDVQYSTEKPWDDLEIRVYPGQDGSFTLYEDDFDGYGYEQGEYTEIPFTWDEESETLTIGARRGHYDNMLSTRQFRLVKVTNISAMGDLPSDTIHATVTYDGSEISVQLKAKSIEKDRLVECTNYITNPSFEQDGRTMTKETPTGWQTDITTSWWGINEPHDFSDPAATDGRFIFGVWDASNTARATISQNITLPAGDYVLTVDMHCSNHDGRNRLGNQSLFASDTSARFADQFTQNGDYDSFPMQTIALNFTQTEDGGLVNIGVTTDGAPSDTWYKIDNFRLYHIIHPEPTHIGEVKSEEGKVKNGIFDLTGRRLNTLPKNGVFIINGNKVLVK